MRTRTAAPMIPQTQPGQTDRVRVERDTGPASRERQEAAKEARRRPRLLASDPRQHGPPPFRWFLTAPFPRWRRGARRFTRRSAEGLSRRP